MDFSFDKCGLRGLQLSRRLQNNGDGYNFSIGETAVIFLFAAIVLTCIGVLAYQGRVSERRRLEEDERQRREVQMKELNEIDERRKAFLDTIQDHGVSVKLTDTHFRMIRDCTSSTSSTLNPSDLSSVVDCAPKTDAENGQEATSGDGDNNKDLERAVVLPRQWAPNVQSTCAICLEPYRPGDTVAWSVNRDCPHAFGQDCLIDYLMQHKDGATAPCPCCRNVFLASVEDEPNDKDGPR